MALTDGLISYWKLDGNSNDAVSTNNGTDTSITYSSGNGKIVQGAGMNGSSSRSSVGNSSALTPNAISIAAWVKRNSTGTLDQILTRDYADSGNANTRAYQFRLDTTDVAQFVPFNASSVGVITGSTTISSGTWYHIVGTWDGTTINLYVNGTSDATGVSFSGTLRSGGANNTYIGADQNGGAGAPANFFDGAIDEVGIWNRALTGAEITQLYNGGSGLAYPFSSSAFKPRVSMFM